MDTLGQFCVFTRCVAVGLGMGALYEPFSLLRAAVLRGRKGRALGIALDVVYAVLAATVCVYAAYALHFPNFHVYWWLGYLAGGIIYLKTLHKIIAFFKKMCYNRLIKRLKKAKRKKKLLQKEVGKI